MILLLKKRVVAVDSVLSFMVAAIKRQDEKVQVERLQRGMEIFETFYENGTKNQPKLCYSHVHENDHVFRGRGSLDVPGRQESLVNLAS